MVHELEYIRATRAASYYVSVPKEAKPHGNQTVDI
jgi:hypothetical protein